MCLSLCAVLVPHIDWICFHQLCLDPYPMCICVSSFERDRKKERKGLWFCNQTIASSAKESTCNARDPSLIPKLRRSYAEGIGYPLQYSWASLVAQAVKNLPAMWETWVQSLGWKDPPTPVFWPGEFHGQRSLEGYSPWRHKELDTTERLSLHLTS